VAGIISKATENSYVACLTTTIIIFSSLLYQVATGGLEAGLIAYPIRKVIHN
jgi:NADH dehydrogenase FAD-containing subunit